VGNIETELMPIAGFKIHPCVACFRCFDEKTGHRVCPSFEDDMEKVYPKLARSDGIIIASPVYFGGITGQLKTLLDRRSHLSGTPERVTGRTFQQGRGSYCSWLQPEWRSGDLYSDDSQLLLVHDMIVVGSGPAETLAVTMGVAQ